MRALICLPFALALGGCVTPTLYQWGGYDQALYAGYKDPAKMDAMRLKIEALIAEMETSKRKVAPGLYAELGTLYLQSGAPTKAVDLYAKERAAWPESTGLMTAMIQNIERRQKPATEAKQ